MPSPGWTAAIISSWPPSANARCWFSTITTEDQRELLEIVEERYDRKATIVTSKLPIKALYNAMQDPTLADAILDRLEQNAYKLELKGESMRRKRSSLGRKTETVTG